MEGGCCQLWPGTSPNADKSERSTVAWSVVCDTLITQFSVSPFVSTENWAVRNYINKYITTTTIIIIIIVNPSSITAGMFVGLPKALLAFFFFCARQEQQALVGSNGWDLFPVVDAGSSFLSAAASLLLGFAKRFATFVAWPADVVVGY